MTGETRIYFHTFADPPYSHGDELDPVWSFVASLKEKLRSIFNAAIAYFHDRSVFKQLLNILVKGLL